MTARLHAIPDTPPKSRRERHREEAAGAALGVFALGSEFAERLRELVEEYGDDLPVAVTEAAPRLARHTEAEIGRFVAAARSRDGRVR